MTTRVKKTRACWQPWESLNIAADGKVYPCCVVHKDLEIGDLSQSSLSEIIHGTAMVELKSKILKGDIAKTPCIGCPNGPIVPIADFHRDLMVRFNLSNEHESEADRAVIEAASATIEDVPLVTVESQSESDEAPSSQTRRGLSNYLKIFRRSIERFSHTAR